MVDSQKQKTINGCQPIIMVAEQKQEQATFNRYFTSYFQFKGNIYSLWEFRNHFKFISYQPVFLNTMRNFKELKISEKLNRKTRDVILKSEKKKKKKKKKQFLSKWL